MKKWWIALVALAIVFAVLLTVALSSSAPASSYKTLLKHIGEKGYAEGKYTVIDVGDAKMYEAEENRLMLYSVEGDEEWGRYISLVRLYIDRAGIGNGVYAWSASIEYEGSTYAIEGEVTAARVSEDMESATARFTYGEEKIDTELFKYQLTEIAKDQLYDIISDFTEYLEESDLALSAEDFGFPKDR